MPTASAARIVRDRSTNARRAPGRMSPAAPARVTLPARRVGSRLAGVSIETPSAVGVDHGDVVADGDEDDVGQPGAEHRTRRSVQRPVAPLDVTAEGDRAERRSVGQTGQEPGLHLVRAGGDEHGTGQQRGHEGARGQGPAELLDDDHDLLQTEARTAERLGDVQTEPAEVGGVGVERGVGFLGPPRAAPGRRPGPGA